MNARRREGEGEMRLRYALPAGLLDAGLASLATLGVGIYAARALSTSELGTYALFFSAFTVAAVLPTQLLLVPAEVATLLAAERERLGVLREGWRLGLPLAAAAAAAGSAAAWLGARAPVDVLGAFALTTTACGIVSPLQDHLRRTLHMAGEHWRAATVSLVQLVAIIVILTLSARAGVRPVWRPFGALTLANLASLSIGYWLSRADLRRSTGRGYRVRRLARSGRWLLLVELATSGAVFLSSTIITRLASPDTLGYAEAARIVAQPLYVVAVGVSAAIWPRSMEAAAGRTEDTARRIARVSAAIVVTVGVLYGAMTVVPWWGNPLGALIPQAYVIEGLVLLSVVALIFIGVAFPPRTELIGAGLEKALVRVAVLAGVLQCLSGVSALWIGAFARPIGIALFGLVLLLGCWHYRRRLYQGDETTLTPTSPPPGAGRGRCRRA
jgi:O-antigen/teichoic acid export membrane protein